MARHEEVVGFCGLTFELSGRQRQDARPGLAKMYRVPPGRAWWPAVGAPLERGVRHLSTVMLLGCVLEVLDHFSGTQSKEEKAGRI
jgi:hypothetical protein